MPSPSPPPPLAGLHEGGRRPLPGDRFVTAGAYGVQEETKTPDSDYILRWFPSLNRAKLIATLPHPRATQYLRPPCPVPPVYGRTPNLLLA
jgi:hypothetical protein